MVGIIALSGSRLKSSIKPGCSLAEALPKVRTSVVALEFDAEARGMRLAVVGRDNVGSDCRGVGCLEVTVGQRL
jgi:hypothetical protein